MAGYPNVENGVPGPDDDAARYSVAHIQEKYAAERSKRLRPDFEHQFVKLHTSDQFKHFAHDPWLRVDGSTHGLCLSEHKVYSFKFVIQGAGFGGLLYAALLVEAGFSPKDIALIDYAGGWDGTWCWNRYPGPMCDVPSDIYMPMLEETGYVPKHKYSYGQELREQAERIVIQYGLGEQGVFRATVSEAGWDETDHVWRIEVCQEKGSKQGVDAIKISTSLRAQYFIPVSGVMNYPKIPRMPGIEGFRGHQFHTSRWDYAYTGGSQAMPDMVKLKNKRVGLVGTGPTNIQVLPELAKWAKTVHVIQRTPALLMSVINKRLILKHGVGSTAFLVGRGDKGEPNLIDDAWTRMLSFKAILGAPNTIDPHEPSTIQAYVDTLHRADLPRQERIHARVDSIVRDKETAKKLKAWCPGWCKRPCFHDNYLLAFNKPNVRLVDTNGKGIDRITDTGIVVGDTKIEVDVLIWGTGFTANLSSSPGGLSGITVRGRDGKGIGQKWEEQVGTLYGFISRDFPNFFFSMSQCGVTANNIHVFQGTCDQTVYAIKTVESRYPGRPVVIEPSQEGEEAWSMRIAANAAAFAGSQGCTPSCYNSEGRADAELEELTTEEMTKKARAAPWGQGILDYQKITQIWRDEGQLEGLEITAVG